MQVTPLRNSQCKFATSYMISKLSSSCSGVNSNYNLPKVCVYCIIEFSHTFQLFGVMPSATASCLSYWLPNSRQKLVQRVRTRGCVAFGTFEKLWSSEGAGSGGLERCSLNGTVRLSYPNMASSLRKGNLIHLIHNAALFRVAGGYRALHCRYCCATSPYLGIAPKTSRLYGTDKASSVMEPYKTQCALHTLFMVPGQVNRRRGISVPSLDDILLVEGRS